MSALEAKIHQGRYDSENELLNLRDNAIAKGRSEIIDAVHQRLKKIHPKIYQRLVGYSYGVVARSTVEPSFPSP